MVEINNAATSNNESSSCSRDVVNQNNLPILPSAPQLRLGHQGGAQHFQEGAHQFQDAPPDYYATVDINSILEIPPAERNPFETRKVHRYMSTKRPSTTQPDL